MMYNIELYTYMYNDILVHKADYNYGCIRNIGDGFMIFIYKYLILTFIICKIYRKPSIFPRQRRKEEYFKAVFATMNRSRNMSLNISKNTYDKRPGSIFMQ